MSRRNLKKNLYGGIGPIQDLDDAANNNATLAANNATKSSNNSSKASSNSAAANNSSNSSAANNSSNSASNNSSKASNNSSKADNNSSKAANNSSKASSNSSNSSAANKSSKASSNSSAANKSSKASSNSSAANNSSKASSNSSAANNSSKASSNSKTSSAAPSDGKGNTVKQIITLVVVAIVLILVIILIKKIVVYFYFKWKSTPWLVKGSKNSKNSLVISQDPENENAVTLNRSSNGEHGIEFTYAFWMLVENYVYKKGEWKHVFHKGNSTSYPNRAPGVWLHPNKNSLRVYMNTFKNILEYVDIENFPIKKWFHVTMTLKQENMDIYINGILKRRHVLSSIPRQNFGDVWVNLFGGYEGFLSRFRYFQKALDFSEIEEIVKNGPSLDTCSDSGETPPYLNDNWWHK